MKRVRKDGSSMFYRVVTQGLPEYAKLGILPPDHAEFGNYLEYGTGLRRFPKNFIREMGQSQNALSREMIKYLSCSVAITLRGDAAGGGPTALYLQVLDYLLEGGIGGPQTIRRSVTPFVYQNVAKQ